MKFDTVIRIPIANTGPHLAPESPVEVSADAVSDSELPLLALFSRTDPSGDPGGSRFHQCRARNGGTERKRPSFLFKVGTRWHQMVRFNT